MALNANFHDVEKYLLKWLRVLGYDWKDLSLKHELRVLGFNNNMLDHGEW